jgi:dihydroorotate dehydrogenase
MNLATQYLGLDLCSPFVVGASPFCDSVYLARKLQDAGAGALVMRSLFEEQLDPPPRRISMTLAGFQTRSSLHLTEAGRERGLTLPRDWRARAPMRSS